MKRLLVMMLFALAAPCLAFGQATRQTSSSAETAVRQADEAWAKAIAAKSVEQTVGFYDPEAMTAGSAMFPAQGLAAFRANWAKLFAQPGADLTWKADKVLITESGTIAYSTGSWRMPGRNASGPYIAVWRKQPDGQWKVLVDAAWNASPPQ
jgi:ketosteroid isomerase-like protein